ncbi:MAG: hypothetical protein ABIK68_13970 [bacterium]
MKKKRNQGFTAIVRRQGFMCDFPANDRIIDAEAGFGRWRQALLIHDSYKGSEKMPAAGLLFSV